MLDDKRMKKRPQIGIVTIIVLKFEIIPSLEGPNVLKNKFVQIKNNIFVSIFVCTDLTRRLHIHMWPEGCEKYFLWLELPKKKKLVSLSPNSLPSGPVFYRDNSVNSDRYITIHRRNEEGGVTLLVKHLDSNLYLMQNK